MADASAILFQSTGATNTPAIASSATAIDANPKRTQWLIQNLGTNPLFVRLGAGASTTEFHTVLKAAVVQDDGSGGMMGQDVGAIYCGIITIAGTTPRYTVLEMTN